MTSTRDRALRIFESLIKDPYYQKTRNSSREEVVWKEAEQRARQANNNELALSMAVSGDETSGAVKSLVAYLLEKAPKGKPTEAQWDAKYEADNPAPQRIADPDGPKGQKGIGAARGYTDEDGNFIAESPQEHELKMRDWRELKRAAKTKAQEAGEFTIPEVADRRIGATKRQSASDLTSAEIKRRQAAADKVAEEKEILSDEQRQKEAAGDRRKGVLHIPQISRPSSGSGRGINARTLQAPAEFIQFDGGFAHEKGVKPLETDEVPGGSDGVNLVYTVAPHDDKNQPIVWRKKNGEPLTWEKPIAWDEDDGKPIEWETTPIQAHIPLPLFHSISTDGHKQFPVSSFKHKLEVDVHNTRTALGIAYKKGENQPPALHGMDNPGGGEALTYRNYLNQYEDILADTPLSDLFYKLQEAKQTYNSLCTRGTAKSLAVNALEEYNDVVGEFFKELEKNPQYDVQEGTQGSTRSQDLDTTMSAELTRLYYAEMYAKAQGLTFKDGNAIEPYTNFLKDFRFSEEDFDDEQKQQVKDGANVGSVWHWRNTENIKDLLNVHKESMNQDVVSRYSQVKASPASLKRFFFNQKGEPRAISQWAPSTGNHPDMPLDAEANTDNQSRWFHALDRLWNKDDSVIQAKANSRRGRSANSKAKQHNQKATRVRAMLLQLFDAANLAEGSNTEDSDIPTPEWKKIELEDMVWQLNEEGDIAPQLQELLDEQAAMGLTTEQLLDEYNKTLRLPSLLKQEHSPIYSLLDILPRDKVAGTPFYERLSQNDPGTIGLRVEVLEPGATRDDPPNPVVHPGLRELLQPFKAFSDTSIKDTKLNSMSKRLRNIQKYIDEVEDFTKLITPEMLNLPKGTDLAEYIMDADNNENLQEFIFDEFLNEENADRLEEVFANFAALGHGTWKSEITPENVANALQNTFEHAGEINAMIESGHLTGSSAKHRSNGTIAVREPMPKQTRKYLAWAKEHPEPDIDEFDSEGRFKTVHDQWKKDRAEAGYNAPGQRTGKVPLQAWDEEAEEWGAPDAIKTVSQFRKLFWEPFWSSFEEVEPHFEEMIDHRQVWRDGFELAPVSVAKAKNEQQKVGQEGAADEEYEYQLPEDIEQEADDYVADTDDEEAGGLNIDLIMEDANPEDALRRAQEKALREANAPDVESSLDLVGVNAVMQGQFADEETKAKLRPRLLRLHSAIVEDDANRRKEASDIDPNGVPEKDKNGHYIGGAPFTLTEPDENGLVSPVFKQRHFTGYADEQLDAMMDLIRDCLQGETETFFDGEGPIEFAFTGEATPQAYTYSRIPFATKKQIYSELSERYAKNNEAHVRPQTDEGEPADFDFATLNNDVPGTVFSYRDVLESAIPAFKHLGARKFVTEYAYPLLQESTGIGGAFLGEEMVGREDWQRQGILDNDDIDDEEKEAALAKLDQQLEEHQQKQLELDSDNTNVIKQPGGIARQTMALVRQFHSKSTTFDKADALDVLRLLGVNGGMFKPDEVGAIPDIETLHSLRFVDNEVGGALEAPKVHERKVMEWAQEQVKDLFDGGTWKAQDVAEDQLTPFAKVLNTLHKRYKEPTQYNQKANAIKTSTFNWLVNALTNMTGAEELDDIGPGWNKQTNEATWPSEIIDYMTKQLNDVGLGLWSVGRYAPSIHDLLSSGGLGGAGLTHIDYEAEHEEELEALKSLFGRDVLNTHSGQARLRKMLEDVDDIYREALATAKERGEKAPPTLFRRRGTQNSIFDGEKNLRPDVLPRLMTEILSLPSELSHWEDWDNMVDTMENKDTTFSEDRIAQYQSLLKSGYSPETISKLISTCYTHTFGEAEEYDLAKHQSLLHQNDVRAAYRYAIQSLTDELDGLGAGFASTDAFGNTMKDRIIENLGLLQAEESFNPMRRADPENPDRNLSGPFRKFSVYHVDDWVKKLRRSIAMELDTLDKNSPTGQRLHTALTNASAKIDAVYTDDFRQGVQATFYQNIKEGLANRVGMDLDDPSEEEIAAYQKNLMQMATEFQMYSTLPILSYDASTNITSAMNYENTLRNEYGLTIDSKNLSEDQHRFMTNHIAPVIAMAEEFGEHENTILSRMLETKEYYQQAADYEADGDTAKAQDARNWARMTEASVKALPDELGRDSLNAVLPAMRQVFDEDGRGLKAQDSTAYTQRQQTFNELFPVNLGNREERDMTPEVMDWLKSPHDYDIDMDSGSETFGEKRYHHKNKDATKGEYWDARTDKDEDKVEKRQYLDDDAEGIPSITTFDAKQRGEDRRKKAEEAGEEYTEEEDDELPQFGAAAKYANEVPNKQYLKGMSPLAKYFFSTWNWKRGGNQAPTEVSGAGEDRKVLNQRIIRARELAASHQEEEERQDIINGQIQEKKIRIKREKGGTDVEPSVLDPESASKEMQREDEFNPMSHEELREMLKHPNHTNKQVLSQIHNPEDEDYHYLKSPQNRYPHLTNKSFGHLRDGGVIEGENGQDWDYVDDNAQNFMEQLPRMRGRGNWEPTGHIPEAWSKLYAKAYNNYGVAQPEGAQPNEGTPPPENLNLMLLKEDVSIPLYKMKFIPRDEEENQEENNENNEEENNEAPPLPPNLLADILPAEDLHNWLVEHLGEGFEQWKKDHEHIDHHGKKHVEFPFLQVMQHNRNRDDDMQWQHAGFYNGDKASKDRRNRMMDLLVSTNTKMQEKLDVLNGKDTLTPTEQKKKAIYEHKINVNKKWHGMLHKQQNVTTNTHDNVQHGHYRKTSNNVFNSMAQRLGVEYGTEGYEQDGEWIDARSEGDDRKDYFSRVMNAIQENPDHAKQLLRHGKDENMLLHPTDNIPHLLPASKLGDGGKRLLEQIFRQVHGMPELEQQEEQEEDEDTKQPDNIEISEQLRNFLISEEAMTQQMDIRNAHEESAKALQQKLLDNGIGDYGEPDDTIEVPEEHAPFLKAQNDFSRHSFSMQNSYDALVRYFQENPDATEVPEKIWYRAFGEDGQFKYTEGNDGEPKLVAHPRLEKILKQINADVDAYIATPKPDGDQPKPEGNQGEIDDDTSEDEAGMPEWDNLSHYHKQIALHLFNKKEGRDADVKDESFHTDMGSIIEDMKHMTEGALDKHYNDYIANKYQQEHEEKDKGMDAEQRQKFIDTIRSNAKMVHGEDHHGDDHFDFMGDKELTSAYHASNKEAVNHRQAKAKAIKTDQANSFQERYQPLKENPTEADIIHHARNLTKEYLSHRDHWSPATKKFYQEQLINLNNVAQAQGINWHEAIEQELDKWGNQFGSEEHFSEAHEQEMAMAQKEEYGNSLAARVKQMQEEGVVPGGRDSEPYLNMRLPAGMGWEKKVAMDNANEELAKINNWPTWKDKDGNLQIDKDSSEGRKKRYQERIKRADDFLQDLHPDAVLRRRNNALGGTPEFHLEEGVGDYVDKHGNKAEREQKYKEALFSKSAYQQALAKYQKEHNVAQAKANKAVKAYKDIEAHNQIEDPPIFEHLDRETGELTEVAGIYHAPSKSWINPAMLKRERDEQSLASLNGDIATHRIIHNGEQHTHRTDAYEVGADIDPKHAFAIPTAARRKEMEESGQMNQAFAFTPNGELIHLDSHWKDRDVTDGVDDPYHVYQDYYSQLVEQEGQKNPEFIGQRAGHIYEPISEAAQQDEIESQQPPQTPQQAQPSAVERFRRNQDNIKFPDWKKKLQETQPFNPENWMTEGEAFNRQVRSGFEGTGSAMARGLGNLLTGKTGPMGRGAELDNYWKDRLDEYNNQNRINDIYQKLHQQKHGEAAPDVHYGSSEAGQQRAEWEMNQRKLQTQPIQPNPTPQPETNEQTV